MEHTMKPGKKLMALVVFGALALAPFYGASAKGAQADVNAGVSTGSRNDANAGAQARGDEAVRSYDSRKAWRADKKHARRDRADMRRDMRDEARMSPSAGRRDSGDGYSRGPMGMRRMDMEVGYTTDIFGNTLLNRNTYGNMYGTFGSRNN